MSDDAPTDAASRDLVLSRLIDAPRDKVFRCWTEPALIVQWFTPLPWRTTEAELELRPGGANNITMEGPNGERMPNQGVYLEVVPNEKLVFTDAFSAGWTPKDGAPFMVAVLTFADEAGPDGRTMTRYVATARHWSVEARAQHEQMGFHTGWGIAADQLEAFGENAVGRPPSLPFMGRVVRRAGWGSWPTDRRPPPQSLRDSPP